MHYCMGIFVFMMNKTLKYAIISMHLCVNAGGYICNFVNLQKKNIVHFK